MTCTISSKINDSDNKNVQEPMSKMINLSFASKDLLRITLSK